MQLNKKILTLVAMGALGVGSIASIGLQAFAQTNPTAPVISSQQSTAQVEQTTGPDTDNIQDQTNDNKPDSAIEANGAEGVETPETGTTAEKELPGGHEDVGTNANHQFEGVE